jgi:hypothetical protein
MTPRRRIDMNTDSHRRIATLMGFEAFTLAIISPLHLSGVLGGGTKPFNPTAAGTAEAIIGAALLTGAVALIRNRRDVAIAATAFAVVGFLFGLSFTLRGGDGIDVAYHATMLPLLLFTLLVLWRKRRPTRRAYLEPPRQQQQIGSPPRYTGQC